MAEMNDKIATLIRNLTEGDIPSEFLTAHQAPGPPPASAGRREALHKIGAVARLAAEGLVPGVTSRRVIERAAEHMGLTWEGVRKAIQRAGTNRILDAVRARALRLDPPAWLVWVEEEAVKAAREYK